LTGFRLGLLNPNTSRDHTDAMARLALSVLPEGSDVVAATAERGPATIESYVDSAVAAAEVVELVRANPGLDAYLVACFGDPALDAARELTDAPVVGIGEAAYRAACLVARRFAVITTLPRSIPQLEDELAAAGVAASCVGVLPLAVPVAEQGAAYGETSDAIVTVSRCAVNELRAEALVLACGAMSETARAIQEEVGVPIVDGVSFGALSAYALWRCGLRTSKTGAYARPEPIPYTAMADFTSAKAL
jgi:allantoin racemase